MTKYIHIYLNILGLISLIIISQPLCGQNLKPDSSSFSIGLHSLNFGSNYKHGFGFETVVFGVKPVSPTDFISLSFYYRSPNFSRFEDFPPVGKFFVSGSYLKTWRLSENQHISNSLGYSWGSEIRGSAPFQVSMLSNTVAHVISFGKNQNTYWATGIRTNMGKFSDKGVYWYLPTYGVMLPQGIYPTVELGLQPKKRAKKWNFLFTGHLEGSQLGITMSFIRKF